jgi:hypothetical protein
LIQSIQAGSILETVMNDVSRVPIDDFENTLSFPGEETSLDSGLPSRLPLGDVPCPSSLPYGFLHHPIGTLNNAIRILAITVLGMLTPGLIMFCIIILIFTIKE